MEMFGFVSRVVKVPSSWRSMVGPWILVPRWNVAEVADELAWLGTWRTQEHKPGETRQSTVPVRGPLLTPCNIGGLEGDGSGLAQLCGDDRGPWNHSGYLQ